MRVIKYLKTILSFLTIKILFAIAFYNLFYDSLFLFEENAQFTLETFSNPLKSKQCEPFKKNYGEFSVKIDGISYPTIKSRQFNNTINFDCLNKDDSLKRILIWNGQIHNYKEHENSLKITGCPVWNCDLTFNKSKLTSSNYVYVHLPDKLRKLPRHRPFNQRWVLAIYESPSNSADFSKYNGYFNLSSTYELDSDFGGIYGHVVWNKNKKFSPNKDYTIGKENLVFAVISNCNAVSKRKAYLNELENYIDVDVYGNCGLSCQSNETLSCKEILAAKYKFLLAFENSICKDYITEKFFDILNYNVVPVVLGGGSYSRHVPPSGYINALDYNTPRDLAVYLRYLDSNKTAYNSYFEWKKYAIVRQSGFLQPLCEICIELNLEMYFGIKHSVVNDLGELLGKKSKCKLPVISNSDIGFNYRLREYSMFDF